MAALPRGRSHPDPGLSESFNLTEHDVRLNAHASSMLNVGIRERNRGVLYISLILNSKFRSIASQEVQVKRNCLTLPKSNSCCKVKPKPKPLPIYTFSPVTARPGHGLFEFK